ncbi:MAG: hypothetical protein OJF52_003814 [Nitrospira sp.]|jgi:hypothetical protein|nr:MAG: hypothetical protein OJF52_003814 [Nitrospira sp.]
MKHLLTTLSSVGILVLFTGCVASHTCSSQDMITMKERGFGVDEISNLCTSYKISEEAVQAMSQTLQSQLVKNRQGVSQPTPAAAPDSYQPASYWSVRGQGSTCATQVGQCRLMQPGPNGAPCVCYTPYGQIPGVVR